MNGSNLEDSSTGNDANNDVNLDLNANQTNKPLNSEDTSLLNSSYADFHEVYKAMRQRQELITKIKKDKIINVSTIHDKSMDYIVNQSLLPSSVKNHS